jgi:PleD family two-component response regulator
MHDHSILLIDPFKNLLHTYRLILEGEGYDVETASDLDGAFDRFASRRYSLILTEYFQPLEETARMIQWVKAKSPDTYLMIVTEAIIDNPAYEKLFAIGLDDLILKPISPEKVLAHMKKGLERREIFLKKRELETQSLLDPMVQTTEPFVFNSVYFKKYLRQEWKRAKRHNHFLSLLLVQIPEKERVGDRFEGFYAELAKVLRGFVREEDFVGRENGHFGVLLPETDQPGSKALMERLVQCIQSHPVFQSDDFLKPIADGLSMQSFTYPEEFGLPGSLMAALEES